MEEWEEEKGEGRRREEKKVGRNRRRERRRRRRRRVKGWVTRIALCVGSGKAAVPDYLHASACADVAQVQVSTASARLPQCCRGLV